MANQRQSESSKSSNRGFAAMSKHKVKQIASKGGKAKSSKSTGSKSSSSRRKSDED